MFSSRTATSKSSPIAAFKGESVPPEWEAVCRLMEEHFRAGRFQVGSIAGVDAIGNLLARHFPQAVRPGRFSQINCLTARLCCR